MMLNVTTVSTIGKFLKTGMPLTHKRLTVAGDAILHPKNLEVPIGTLTVVTGVSGSGKSSLITDTLAPALEQYRKLQKAWDTGNVIEISDFTTTEVFTAITHQLRERGAQAYKSDIKELKNELLGITESDGVYLANIRFTGRIEIDGEVEEFDETWILEKPVEGDEGWLLGGIQQNA